MIDYDMSEVLDSTLGESFSGGNDAGEKNECVGCVDNYGEKEKCLGCTRRNLVCVLKN